jgi:aminoglycoside phosphotransferase (APT) family kinase protein
MSPGDVLVGRRLMRDERDPEVLAARVAEWLGSVLGADGPVRVEAVSTPAGSGMSAVTLVLDCSWRAGGRETRRRLVARVAPEESAYPVFPTYDVGLQHEVMTGVQAAAQVPVPRLVAVEETGSVVGSPFLVMEHVQGRAPLDNPPYVVRGWLHDATAEERARLEEETLGVVAALHAINEPRLVFPRLAALAGDDALRAHVDAQRAYYAWTHERDGVRVPLLERAFARLEETWPADPGEAVLSWGDARPGNVLFDGFRPAAVLDWEMAALAPRGVDVGWYVFLHRFFQDIAEAAGLPGLPDLGRPDKVAATYRRLSGHELEDLDWYVLYAATRHGVVMSRIKRRKVLFGAEALPEDPDDYVMHRAALERLLDQGAADAR